MDNLQAVILALLAGGGGSVLVIFGKGLRNYLTGRAADERGRIVSLVKERDAADAYRRVVQEYASGLRGTMNEHGLGHLVGEWPPNPAQSDPTATRRSRRND